MKHDFAPIGETEIGFKRIQRIDWARVGAHPFIEFENSLSLRRSAHDREVVQRTVLYLGEINDQQQGGWRKMSKRNKQKKQAKETSKRNKQYL